MIEVFFNNTPWADRVDVYITRRDSLSGKRYLVQFGKHNQTQIQLSEYGEIHEPTFTLAGADATETLKAFADAVARMGIKTDEDKKREGKLEAVEKHLADMRSIVFKKQIGEKNAQHTSYEPRKDWPNCE